MNLLPALLSNKSVAEPLMARQAARGFIMTETPNSLPQFEFQGFQSPNTTQVPDELFDKLLTVLSGAELKVLLYVTRRTFGFKKDSDNISLAQMLNGIKTRDGRVIDGGAGLTKKTLLKAITSLESKKIIFTERRRSLEKGDEPTTYRLNIVRSTPGEKITLPLGEKLHQGGSNQIPPGPWGTNSPTQQTVIQETEEQHFIVVDTLTNFGISKRVAQKLTDTYPEDYLLQKLDLVQWMVATGSSLVGKNPSGYLRRAIEEDYLPPLQYQTPEQRQKDEAAQQQRKEAEADHRRTKERLQQLLREEHPPQPVGEDGLTTESAWVLTLEQLKEQIPRPAFETWLKNTMLLEVTGNTAQVMVSSQATLDWLEKRLYQSIARALGGVLQQEVEVEFVAPQSPE